MEQHQLQSSEYQLDFLYRNKGAEIFFATGQFNDFDVVGNFTAQFSLKVIDHQGDIEIVFWDMGQNINQNFLNTAHFKRTDTKEYFDFLRFHCSICFYTGFAVLIFKFFYPLMKFVFIDFIIQK